MFPQRSLRKKIINAREISLYSLCLIRNRIKKCHEITRDCSKATRLMQNTRFISHTKTGKKMRARKNSAATMPRKEDEIMMKQLTENG